MAAAISSDGKIIGFSRALHSLRGASTQRLRTSPLRRSMLKTGRALAGTAETQVRDVLGFTQDCEVVWRVERQASEQDWVGTVTVGMRGRSSSGCPPSRDVPLTSSQQSVLLFSLVMNKGTKCARRRIGAPSSKNMDKTTPNVMMPHKFTNAHICYCIANTAPSAAFQRRKWAKKRKRYVVDLSEGS